VKCGRQPSGRRPRFVSACSQQGAFISKAVALAALILWSLSPVLLAQDRVSLARANAAYQSEDFSTAVKFYEEALARDPSNTDLHFFLGHSYDRLYQPARKGEPSNDSYLTNAIEHYLKAAEQARTPSLQQLSLQYLVSTYQSPDRSNEPARAEPILQRMIAATPDEPRNYFVLARLYEDTGDLVRAEQQLTLAQERRPDDASVYMNLAGFYQRQGNFDKMIDAVQERARRQPDNPEAFYTIATFYWEKASRDLKLSDTQKATYAQAGLEAVDKALELKNDYFEALTYKNLLLRTQANISKDAAEQQLLLKEADELRTQAEELRNRQRATAAQK
jgi:tetratricopeptide (TPR) repeat protein